MILVLNFKAVVKNLSVCLSFRYGCPYERRGDVFNVLPKYIKLTSPKWEWIDKYLDSIKNRNKLEMSW